MKCLWMNLDFFLFLITFGCRVIGLFTAMNSALLETFFVGGSLNEHNEIQSATEILFYLASVMYLEKVNSKAMLF